MATDLGFERSRSSRRGVRTSEVGPHCAVEFSIREARAIIHDLFVPKPWIYWCDLVVSIAVGYAAFTLVRLFPTPSVAQTLAYVVSCLALYRAASFTHELVHLKGEHFGWYRLAWNLLCGIPFFMPSFMYHTHLAH